MNEEIEKVLEMLKEGKVSKDEAVKLIEALKDVAKDQQPVPQNKRKRFLKIHVTRKEKPEVNITLPFGLINWGLNIADRMGKKNMVNLGGEDIPIDLEELKKAMNDPEFTGKIVDVNEEDDERHVEIEIV